MKNIRYFYIIFLFHLLWNTILFAETDILSSIENNHNFNPPSNTINKIINSRKNLNEIRRYVVDRRSLAEEIYNDFSQASVVDLSKIQQFRACTYFDEIKGNITAEFQKKGEKWSLIRIFNSNNKNIGKKSLFKGNYELHEANNCFGYFVRKWEKLYKKSKLRFVYEGARISNIRLVINKKSLKATFNLQYVYPTQKSFKNGWLVSSAFLNKSQDRNIVSSPLPKSEQAFHIEDALTSTEIQNANVGKSINNEKGISTPVDKSSIKLTQLTCHNHERERKIRLSFQLSKVLKISSLIQTHSNNNKLYTFSLNGKKAKINFNNCIFLKTNANKNLFNIDIIEFPKFIVGIKYGSGNNAKISFIDYYY